ncbi:class I SAM-dependent DNA methyltransferase [Wenxinia saemankumensis]|uniref:Methyltransferase domain-containing protein n=1 Tax=Wenxinia saemankumensis TaxID=1447782 RepID=A0A1M6AKH9_9RHOB|nr:class I SAM-dependent methyltransferase [Wenxinia saemankumensis]SHI36838.1 Methyltransferase domain-containing protein [Wenxinia saemankumensis]
MTDGPDLERAYRLSGADDNRRLYRDWAATYDSDFTDRHGYRLPLAVAGHYMRSGGAWPCLDVGCGTGAVGAALPDGAVVDGLDLSPEMLDRARAKGIYRALHERDLGAGPDLPEGSYRGLVSSGMFTHGHVGPGALGPLLRLLVPGGIAVIAVNSEVFEGAFDLELDRLRAAGLIGPPHREVERNYADPAKAPEGHGEDTSEVLILRRPD